MIDLSIIIVAYNVKDVLEECLTKIKNSKDRLKKEAIFVDNSSSDGTDELIQEKFPETILIRTNENLGFIRANNLAYKKARGKYILMLNSDAFIGEETLQRTVGFMEGHPDCGVLGCRLVERDGTLQPSARYFITPWRAFLTHMGWANKFSFLKGIDDLERDHSKAFECDWVPGCFLLTRKKIIDELGFFLRNDFFMYYDDVDLCVRIKKKGWKVFFYPEDVVHLGGENNRRAGIVTKAGKQIEKLDMESSFIHFRKNYNVFYVIAQFFFILLFDVAEMIKVVIKGRQDITIRERFGHIKLSISILKRTKFGKIPIH